MSNIGYELAKKLKDAGFPQKGEGVRQYFRPDGTHDRTEFGHRYEQLYIPTLSELIAACGDELNALFRHPEEDGNWKAGYMVGTWEGVDWGRVSPARVGSTPEEAVTNFWLVSNNHE